jgi:NAD(P)-dependent dehydrogenase (short-subunit alcohol dehydrogenase family)
LRILTRRRRAADANVGTLVAAVCPGLVDTEASRPWFADMGAARTAAEAALRAALRTARRAAAALPAQTPAVSRTCVSRRLLPEGSRNPESMPYGRSSGGSVNSTPRPLSSS